MRETPDPTLEVFPRCEFPRRQLLDHHYTFEDVLRRYSIGQKNKISYGYLNQVQKHLKGFVKYLKGKGFKSFYLVQENTLIEYREFLWREFVNRRDGALVVRSQVERLRCVVRLFRYLYDEGILKKDPTKNLDWEQYYKDIVQKSKTLPRQPVENDNLTERDKLKLKFLEYERGRGLSKGTVKKYKKGIEVFYEFLDNKDISELAQIDQRLLWEYYTYVCNYEGGRGNPASNGYKNHILGALKQFFGFLVRFDFLLDDPRVNWESFKETRGLSYTYMNQREINMLLEAPLLSGERLALRDKAILEMLYSSGLRSNELCCLDVEDIDFEEEMVRVRSPKGGAKYQRVVPVGQIALKYLRLYVEKERPGIDFAYSSEALFVSYRGKRLNNNAILDIVKKHAFQCGLRKRITTHSLRVTCATDMLKNGADIRHVQEQLGHERLTSTQIYTRINVMELKKVHSICHPR